jgi:hypothetical protein
VVAQILVASARSGGRTQTGGKVAERHCSGFFMWAEAVTRGE